jgi:hypothetical protein
VECPDFPPIKFPRNSQKHESELATFDRPTKLKHTSVINVRVSPIFMKQEELISRAGRFCGFGQVGAKFAGKWIHWRWKVELKFFRWKFQEIYWIDSLVLEMFDVSLEFLSFRFFEAIRDEIWAWKEEFEWSSQFHDFPAFVLEFSVNFWRWFQQLCDSLGLIKTFLCVELHDWFGWSFKMKWWNYLLVNVLDSRSLIAAGWPTVLVWDFLTEFKSTRAKSSSTLDILKF